MKKCIRCGCEEPEFDYGVSFICKRCLAGEIKDEVVRQAINKIAEDTLGGLQ